VRVHHTEHAFVMATPAGQANAVANCGRSESDPRKRGGECELTCMRSAALFALSFGAWTLSSQRVWASAYETCGCACNDRLGLA